MLRHGDGDHWTRKHTPLAVSSRCISDLLRRGISCAAAARDSHRDRQVISHCVSNSKLEKHGRDPRRHCLAQHWQLGIGAVFASLS